MWAEFRTLLVKTNALALALAVILGLALAAVVTSLVGDIIMPPIGLALGKVDFQNMYLNLSGGTYPSLRAAKDAGAATINYGVFINQVITFVVVALVVFLIGRRFIPNVPTKVCPRCAASDLPLAATRCPHCTSDLTPARG
jgi:large conductance mechanosensitive channel